METEEHERYSGAQPGPWNDVSLAARPSLPAHTHKELPLAPRVLTAASWRRNAMGTPEPGMPTIESPPLPAVLKPGSPARPNMTYGHRRTGTAGEGLRTPSSVQLEGRRGSSPPFAAAPARKPAQQLKQLVQVCCRLMVPQSPPAVLAAATCCLAVVLSVHDQLAAFICLSVPQALDRLLGVMLVTMMDASAVQGQAQHEEVALVVAAAPAQAAALRSGQGSLASVTEGASVNQRTGKLLRGGVGGPGGPSSFDSMVCSPLTNMYKSMTMGSVAVVGSGGNDGPAAPSLQQQLCCTAHAVALAMYVVRLLAGNARVVGRVVAHPLLPQALDKMLHDENVHQVHTMLDLVQAQYVAHLRIQIPEPSDRPSVKPGYSAGLATDDRPSMVSATGTINSLASSSTSQGDPPPNLRLMAAALVVCCAPTAQAQGLPLVGPHAHLIATLAAMMHEQPGHMHDRTLALQASTALLPNPKAAAAMVRRGAGEHSLVMGLLHLLKTQEPGARVHAAGVLATLVQQLSGALLTEVGAVDGLLPVLVDMAIASGDTYMRNYKAGLRSSVGQLGMSSGSIHMPANTNSLTGASKASPGSSMDWGDGSTPAPGAVQDPALTAWLAPVAALAGLSRSGPVAARIASLRGVPNMLLAALKLPGSLLAVYAAGLVGNLASHTASQALLAMTNGLGREVAKAVRHQADPVSYALLLGAVRNLAATDRGRQELANEPGLVPLLTGLINQGVNTSQSSSIPLSPFSAMTTEAAQVSRLQLQVLSASILANLSADKVGLEAVVADQAQLLSCALALLSNSEEMVDDRISPANSDPAQSPLLHMLRSAGKESEDRWQPQLAVRLRCYTAVLVANAMSHFVLARSLLTSPNAGVLRDAIMKLPSPSLAALNPEPLSLLGDVPERVTAVACLTAMRNLMASAGPRAVAWLAAQPLTPLSQLGFAPAPASPPAVLKPRVPGETGGHWQGGSKQDLPSLESGGNALTPSTVQFVAKVLDLLAWVDFYDPHADAVGACPTGLGVDVAGAAAGLLGMLAAHGCMDHFGAAERQAVAHLLRCAALSALDGAVLSSNAGGHTPDVVEEAACQSVMALWVVSSHPGCAAWAKKLGEDPLVIHTLLLLCKRGTRASTRARFSTTRLLAAAALGQLLVQGLIHPQMHERVVGAVMGVPSGLMDLATLALAAAGPAGQAQPGPKAGEPVRHHKRKGAAPSAAEIQDTARTDALKAVGVQGEMQAVVGMQAAGALAHVAGIREGSLALLAAPAARTSLPQLLACPADEVALAAVMILAGACSHADPAILEIITNSTELMAGLHVALARPHAHTACYAAVCMANLALHPPAQPAVLMPGTLSRLAQLVTAPLLSSSQPPVLSLPPSEQPTPTTSSKVQGSRSMPGNGSLPTGSAIAPGFPPVRVMPPLIPRAVGQRSPLMPGRSTTETNPVTGHTPSPLQPTRSTAESATAQSPSSPRTSLSPAHRWQASAMGPMREPMGSGSPTRAGPGSGGDSSSAGGAEGALRTRHSLVAVRARLPSLSLRSTLSEGNNMDGAGTPPGLSHEQTVLLAASLSAACAAAGALQNLSCESRHCEALLAPASPALPCITSLLHGSEGLHAMILAAGGEPELLQSMEHLLLLILGTLANLAAVPQGQKQLLASPVLLAALMAAFAAHHPATSPTRAGDPTTIPPSPSEAHFPRSSAPGLPLSDRGTRASTNPAVLRQSGAAAATPVQVAALGALANLLGAGDPETADSGHTVDGTGTAVAAAPLAGPGVPIQGHEVEAMGPEALSPFGRAMGLAGAAAFAGGALGPLGRSNLGRGLSGEAMSLADLMGAMQSDEISLPSPNVSLPSPNLVLDSQPASVVVVQGEDPELMQGRQALLLMLRELTATRQVLSSLAGPGGVPHTAQETRAVQHMAGWVLHQLGAASL